MEEITFCINCTHYDPSGVCYVRDLGPDLECYNYEDKRQNNNNNYTQECYCCKCNYNKQCDKKCMK